MITAAPIYTADCFLPAVQASPTLTNEAYAPVFTGEPDRKRCNTLAQRVSRIPAKDWQILFIQSTYPSRLRISTICPI